MPVMNERDKVHEACRNLRRFLDGEIDREEFNRLNDELLDARFVQQRIFTDTNAAGRSSRRTQIPHGGSR